MKKYLSRVSCLVFMIFILPAAAMAADQPKLVTGTQQLLNDATGWLLVLVPVSTAFLAGWNYWLKSINQSDHVEASNHGKNAKKVIIAGIIIEGIVGLVNTLLSYYV